MQYIMLGDPNVAKTVCILSIHLNKESIQKTYLQPFGLDEDAFMVMSLYQDPLVKKTPKATLTEYAKTELIPTLQEQGIKYLLCTDPEYFKVLSGEQKVEGNMGYILPCVLDKGMFVAFAPSYKSVFYDPDKIKPKIERAIHALAKHWEGDYVEPGSSIVKFEQYPDTVDYIANWLDKLIEMDCPLTCDIEAFSLKHHTAGIGSITFCWNQHEGIAFLVDYVPIAGAVVAPYGNQGYNAEIRTLLVNFFRRMKHKVIYHNVAYDAYVLIYQLFMSSVIDTAGLLEGIKVMLRDWDCTKLIAYLATNSCAGNDLKLKTLAQSFAGDWAQDDIKDIRNIQPTELLRYNLIDGLSTWFVHTKHYVPMVMDLQSDIYENLFQPTTVDLIQMQLTGMPLNKQRVVEVKAILQQDFDSAVQRISGCALVQEYEYARKVAWVEQRNLKLKKKRVTLADADVEILKAKNDISWNPNSYPQMQELLYSRIGLPVIELTDSKQPAVDGDTVKNLKNHTTDPQVLALLDAFIDYTAVNKILTSFIPAMENAALGPDGWHYLFGSFNLGGTVSGRLSASNPNLQQLPANGKYAKLIKSCFQAPPGWLFCGLDFASLEDRISALTTKDPRKLEIYIGVKQYELTINNTIHKILGDTIVRYDGQELTGEQLYEKLQNSKL